MRKDGVSALALKRTAAAGIMISRDVMSNAACIARVLCTRDFTRPPAPPILRPFDLPIVSVYVM